MPATGAHTVSVAFAQPVVDDLLAKTGRMCAICNRLHGVQVHHIVPRHKGGTDDASNAMPLCPNCHDEVHAGYAPGRTTRLYTRAELLAHLERTIQLAERQARLSPGDEDWEHDVRLVRFFAQCLDRPAFRAHFHQELSFADLDQALEDTGLAINTGLSRTRDGTLIERSEGKRALVNPVWRDKVDRAVGSIDEARRVLRGALGLDRMMMTLSRFGPHHWIDTHDDLLRRDSHLGDQMDAYRQEALDAMNEVLAEAQLPSLKPIGTW